MQQPVPQGFINGPVEIFDSEAITDPVRIAQMTKGLRRPSKTPAWMAKAFIGGLCIVCLVLGILLGRFVF